MSLDWNSTSSEVLFNPKLPVEEKRQFVSLLPKEGAFQGHVWVATSGTSGRTKFAALSKNAFLVSAKAVNDHLASTASDCWLHTLPDFHVGGLGIWARAHLSGAKVVDFKSMHTKWDIISFYKALEEFKATLTSLVPAQVYDLTSRHLKAPKPLRAVIVGGGAMSQHLFQEAANLGWNLLPGYAMTECASTIALGRNGDGCGTILPHVELKIDKENYICLKSSSLLTAYGFLEHGKIEIVDPKKDGWFKSEDKGELLEGLLKVHGRDTDFIKIGGESCSLVELRKLWDEINRSGDRVIAAIPDERLGHVIHLFSENGDKDNVQQLVEKFNARVLPFEKIRQVHYVEAIPRSPLGKVLYSQLR